MSSSVTGLVHQPFLRFREKSFWSPLIILSSVFHLTDHRARAKRTAPQPLKVAKYSMTLRTLCTLQMPDFIARLSPGYTNQHFISLFFLCHKSISATSQTSLINTLLDFFFLLKYKHASQSLQPNGSLFIYLSKTVIHVQLHKMGGEGSSRQMEHSAICWKKKKKTWKLKYFWITSWHKMMCAW